MCVKFLILITTSYCCQVLARLGTSMNQSNVRILEAKGKVYMLVLLCNQYIINRISFIYIHFLRVPLLT